MPTNKTKQKKRSNPSDALFLGTNRAKELLVSSKISPQADPDFPFRLLEVWLGWDKAFVYADLFNRGQMPDPITIAEPKLRQLVMGLRGHYLYGRWAKRSFD